MSFILSVESFVEIGPGLAKQFKPGHKQPQKSMLMPPWTVFHWRFDVLDQIKGSEKAFSPVACSDKLNPLKFSTVWGIPRV